MMIHCLIITNICAKIFNTLMNGLDMDLTQCDGWTDRQMWDWIGIKGHFYCNFLLFNRGSWPLFLLLQNELYCSLLFCLQLDGPISLFHSVDRQMEPISISAFFPRQGVGTKTLYKHQQINQTIKIWCFLFFSFNGFSRWDILYIHIYNHLLTKT
jgi:hypothetical protein